MLINKKVFFLVLMIASSSFNVYGQSNNEVIKAPKQVAKQDDSVGQDGNWIYLTKEQRLKDFDYLYEELKENYPYFEVVKRVKNIDLDKQYKVIRKEIANCKNDNAYFEALQKYCNIDVGHMCIWGR